MGPQHEISFISPFWRLEFWSCSYIFFICAHHFYSFNILWQFYSSNILWSVNNESFIWIRWVVVIKKKFSLFLAKLHAVSLFGFAEVKFREFLNPALEWELLLVTYRTAIIHVFPKLMRFWWEYGYFWQHCMTRVKMENACVSVWLWSVSSPLCEHVLIFGSRLYILLNMHSCVWLKTLHLVSVCLLTSFPKLSNGFYLDFVWEFTLVIVRWIWPAHCTWYYRKYESWLISNAHSEILCQRSKVAMRAQCVLVATTLLYSGAKFHSFL